jgi:tetratricopeptide (TPR) repeat protein
MTDSRDEFVTIRPRRIAPPESVPASPSLASREATPTTAPHRHTALFVLVALAAVAIIVFSILPGAIEKPLIVATPAPPPQSASSTPAEQAAAPYAAMRHARERSQAETLLRRFVELQVRLDDELSVDHWAKEAFDAAQRLANEGDTHFVEERFAAAFERYEQGVAALEELVTAAESRFDAALGRALEALARGDRAAATTALDEAAVIHPQDPRIAEARARLERAPRIVELTARGDEAMQRGAFREAADAYAAAAALDPAQAELATLAAQARARASDAAFAARLSEGYAALDAGNLDAARRAFEAALAERPDDRAAADGLAQASQSGTLTRIERLQRTAERQVAEESWVDARRTYGEVLAVDPTLKFAVDGQRHADERIELDRALEAALGDPGALAKDAVFAETVALYDRAVALDAPGQRLTAQLDRLEAMLATAARPITVVLTSDAATDITVFQVGPIGRFERKELALRPGRYVVTGSRRGCRDVRLEIDVKPAMAPVDVRCEETL